MKCRRTTKAGAPCGNHAVRGATVCMKHGGASPDVQRKAAVVVELSAWGLLDSTEDPGEVLLRLVTQSARRASYYGQLLKDHQDRDADASTGYVAGLVEIPRELRGLIGFKIAAAGKDGDLYAAEEAIRGLVVLEAQERDRCAKFAKTALDAGIAERQVRLAERQGALIAEVLRAVFSDPELGLTAEQRKAIPGVARRHLALTS